MGAFSAVLIGTVITASFGLQGFALMAGFFLIGSSVTKLGYAKKAALGIAQEALAVAPQPLIGIDPCGMIALANGAASRLFPERGPLIGQGADEALPAALTPLLDSSARRVGLVLAGETFQVEAHPLGRDGDERGLLLSFQSTGSRP